MCERLQLITKVILHVTSYTVILLNLFCSTQQAHYCIKNLKISSSIIKWFEDYLSGRTQRTRVNRSLSTPSKVTSGVPQSSVLGPLLFLIFIEDLIRRLIAVNNVSLFMYADDIKLLSGSLSKLQTALIIVKNWSANW